MEAVVSSAAAALKYARKMPSNLEEDFEVRLRPQSAWPQHAPSKGAENTTNFGKAEGKT